jgi:hypothetical protein
MALSPKILRLKPWSLDRVPGYLSQSTFNPHGGVYLLDKRGGARREARVFVAWLFHSTGMLDR